MERPPWISEIAVTGAQLQDKLQAALSMDAEGLPRLYSGGSTWTYDAEHSTFATPRATRDDRLGNRQAAPVDPLSWSLSERSGVLVETTDPRWPLEIREGGRRTRIGMSRAPEGWRSRETQILLIARAPGAGEDALWLLIRPILPPAGDWTPRIMSLPLEGGEATPLSRIPSALRRVLDAEALGVDTRGNAWGLDYEPSSSPGQVQAALRISYHATGVVRRQKLYPEYGSDAPWEEVGPERRSWTASSPPLSLMALPQARMLAIVPPIQGHTSPSAWLVDPVLQHPCLVTGEDPIQPIEEATDPAPGRPELAEILGLQTGENLYQLRGNADVVVVRSGDPSHDRPLWAPLLPALDRPDNPCLSLPGRPDAAFCLPGLTTLVGKVIPQTGLLCNGQKVPIASDGSYTIPLAISDSSLTLTPVDMRGIPGPSQCIYVAPYAYFLLVPIGLLYLSTSIGGISSLIGRNRASRCAAALRSTGFVQGLDSPAFFFGRAKSVRAAVRALSQGRIVIIGGPQRTGKSWIASIVQMGLLCLAGSVRHYREMPIAPQAMLFEWTDPRRPFTQILAWLGLSPARPECRCVAISLSWSAHHDTQRAWKHVADELTRTASEIYKESTLEPAVARATSALLSRPRDGDARAWMQHALATMAEHEVRLVLVLADAKVQLSLHGKHTPSARVFQEILKHPWATALVEGPRLEHTTMLLNLFENRSIDCWSTLPPLGWFASVQLLRSLSHLSSRRPSLWCSVRMAHACRREPYLLQQAGKKVLEQTGRAPRPAYPAPVARWSDVATDVRDALADLEQELRILADWSDDDLRRLGWAPRSHHQGDPQ